MESYERVPIDMLWFSLPKPDDAPPPPPPAYLDRNALLPTIDRSTYYQWGMVIRKGWLRRAEARGH